MRSRRLQRALGRPQDFFAKVKIAKRIFLCLDFDGTLAPIVRDPAKARLSREKREMLSGITNEKRCTLAFISGRALADLKGRIGLAGVYYVGNHGLEIEGRGVRFIHPKAKEAKGALRRLETVLKRSLKDYKGSLLENKGFTLSVHYRCVKRNHQGRIKETVCLAAAGILREKFLKVSFGKKVIEFKPDIAWHKGKALRYLKKTLFSGMRDIFTIYLGDDTTDEDAFEEANRTGGQSIFVGKKPQTTQAALFLASTVEVSKWLKLFTRNLNLSERRTDVR